MLNVSPPMTIESDPDVHAARDVLTRARRDFEAAKVHQQDLVEQERSSADPLVRSEAARDRPHAEQTLLETDIACQKAQRRLAEAVEQARRPVVAHWQGRLQDAHAELVTAVEAASRKNEALREVHAAAVLHGVTLPQVHLQQLTHEFVEHWRPTSRRELGLPQ